MQTLFGLCWASAGAGIEVALGAALPTLSLSLLAALLFLAIGPSVLAYRCWGLGVVAVGPAVAGFFSNRLCHRSRRPF